MLVQMLDSNGKLSSGILRGGLIWPGHFEECNSVYAPDDSKGHGGFHGKYCITSWTLDIIFKTATNNWYMYS
ncbi:nose resistant to fluoxetine protein 6 [Caerostris extrusa]|uniref:Nose resistant to fluoxetine protein 6 n=1 Tax=Caerostris extrusa TaxID=172846 RepID=A0AAV4VZI9_CAEEX|nr:nose resistant to fluoxetine protein 6 [Caerostris extrusa]